MKKILAFILIFVFVISLTACSSEEKVNNQHNELITKALAEVEKTVKEEYNQSYSKGDGYFEIKNTRIIEIKENDTEIFKDIDYVIEFLSFNDYFGSAPYYNYTGIDDCAVVYKSGKIEVFSGNPFHRYGATTYSYDFSDIINSVTDYGTKYNCVKDLK